MAGARGDALEWALALAKAPSERRSLRLRVLPEGMENLLQIAAGASGEALEAAAARSGESESTVLEASRFYAREILFHQGADAYRVLGLNRDSSSEELKAHHRLLQQWLHPDRHTSDWDAIFASRVNAAWNQLRVPARRAEYDAQNPAKSYVEDSGPSWLISGQLTAGMGPAPIADDNRWRRRSPLLVLFAICGLLGVLALRDQQREPMSELSTFDNADAVAPKEEPELALRVPVVTKNDVARKVVAEPKPRRQVVAAVSNPESNPIKPAQSAPKPVSPLSRVASAPTPASKRVAPVVAAVPAQAPRTDATKAAYKPVVVAKAPPKLVVPVPIASPVQKPERVVAKAAHAKTPESMVMMASPQPAPVNVAPVANNTAPTAKATTQQVSQVQQTGQQLLAFIVGKSAATPPIWDSASIQAQASQARTSLQTGGGARGGDPRWRIGGSTAAMSADMQAGDDVRRLRVDFVWREQRWLVSGFTLEQAQ